MSTTLLRAGRRASAPLLLGAAAVVISLVSRLTTALEYDRIRIIGGEAWRLVTCHWTHWSAEHLLLDAVVLVVLGVVCALYCGRRWLACVTAAAVLIPIALWLALPHMIYYRGLSGIDAALYALLAVAMLRHDVVAGRWRTAWLPAVAVVGLAAKIAYELSTGQAAFVDSAGAGFVPVPLAHAVGGLVGVVFGLLPRLERGPSAVVAS